MPYDPFVSAVRPLPPEIQVCPIQLPGRENRRGEPPFTRLAPLVKALADVFRNQVDVPFALFGHSFGSMIAFELARELRRRNLPGPQRLFVSASRAPDVDDPHPPVHNLPEPEFLATMCTRFKAIPEAILEDQELLRFFLPVMRADLEMMDTYVYSPEEPLACPISAFGGLEDVAVGREDLLPWSRQTSSLFTLRMLPGDHFFPRTAQKALLEAVLQDLDAR